MKKRVYKTTYKLPNILYQHLGSRTRSLKFGISFCSITSPRKGPGPLLKNSGGLPLKLNDLDILNVSCMNLKDPGFMDNIWHMVKMFENPKSTSMPGVQAALGVQCQRFADSTYAPCNPISCCSSGLWFHFLTKADSGLVKDLKVVGDRLEGQGCSFLR